MHQSKKEEPDDEEPTPDSDDDIEDYINEPLYREIVKPFLQMLLVFFSAENNENLRVRDINQFFAKTTHQAKLRLLRGLFEKSGNGVLDKKTVHVQVYSIFGRASPIWGSLYLISDELLPGLNEVRDLVTEKGEIDQEKLETFKAKNEWLQPDDSVAG